MHQLYLFRRAVFGVGVLLALAACGRGESVAVSLQPATSPTLDAYPEPEGSSFHRATPLPTPTDGSRDADGNPRPSFTPADFTAIALQEMNLRAEADMKATSQALPTYDDRNTPPPAGPDLPSVTPQAGINDRCARQIRVAEVKYFDIDNCWYAVVDGYEIRVAAGGANFSTDPINTSAWRGGMFITRRSLSDGNDIIREPIYWTPTNGGLVDVVAANDMVLTVRADDGTLSTFDVATRTWGPPPTATPEPQPETQPTSTIEAQPETTPTSPVTIFVPWAQ